MIRDEDARNRIVDALGNALVEIRASKNLKACNALADIFHNVPARLNRGHPESEIEEEIVRRADRVGMREYLDAILKRS
jgi:hypothetical protein